MKFEGRFTERKSAKNNDGQKTPHLEAQNEKSFQKSLYQKKSILGFKKMKKTESSKMASKVLYELLIRGYERLTYFLQT